MNMRRIEKFACVERLPNGEGCRVIPKKKMKHGTLYVGFDKKGEWADYARYLCPCRCGSRVLKTLVDKGRFFKAFRMGVGSVV